ncbi:serine hydrolase domain-containing protein [Riemerella columbina]|uniref:serine hydrolase domain-containing protein n=1 Tax=Riemerella columbina TaxID=103810 RepID=UPI00267039D6|nr:serine hydrolase domain-containing protein [Riemerella columbina]WKS95977.1 beta-lactamase family protein [Riemerella columbina]
MKRKILITLGVGLYFQLGIAQSFNAEKLNKYFNSLVQKNKAMGSVALAKNGQILYTNVFGFSDVVTQQKADENSKYRIGSISKTFTAVLVFKAIEAQKLSLNQTIGQWFLTIKNSDKITVADLLQHRSGIHNFTEVEDYIQWNTQQKSEAEMVKIIAKGGSDFEPNSQGKYSNSNYVLLSYILEKVMQKPYADLLREYIVQPLGLKNTAVFKSINPVENECLSYQWNDGWNLESQTASSVPVGAGNIMSTPTDLVKFTEALFTGKLIKPEHLNLMKTIKDGYGMGLFQFPFMDKKLYGHTGGIDGFHSVFSYDEHNKIAYAMVLNGLNYDMNAISITVMSEVYSEPYELPKFETYVVPAKQLVAYVGVYASSELPIKVIITQSDAGLTAQATGQASFALEATAEHQFQFDLAGIVLIFNPKEQTMVLKQNGLQFLFKKEK